MTWQNVIGRVRERRRQKPYNYYSWSILITINPDNARVSRIGTCKIYINHSNYIRFSFDLNCIWQYILCGFYFTLCTYEIRNLYLDTICSIISVSIARQLLKATPDMTFTNILCKRIYLCEHSRYSSFYILDFLMSCPLSRWSCLCHLYGTVKEDTHTILIIWHTYHILRKK